MLLHSSTDSNSAPDATLSADAADLLAAVGGGALWVDEIGRLTRYTECAATLVCCAPCDIGQSLTAIADRLNESSFAEIAVKGSQDDSKVPQRWTQRTQRGDGLQLLWRGATIFDEKGISRGALLLVESEGETGREDAQACGASGANNEQLADVVFRLDSQLRHLSINAEVERMTGVAAREFIGKTGREAGMAPLLCDQFEAQIRQLMSSGRDCEWEFRFHGHTFRTRIRGEHGEDGRIVSVIGITEDIGHQKREAAAWRQSEAELRMALEAAEMGTWTWIVDEHHIVWSDHISHLLGLPPNEQPQTPAGLAAIIHPDDCARVMGEIEASLLTDEKTHLEFRVSHPDGATRWVSTESQVVSRDDNGRATRKRGVMSDITARKEMEQTLRAGEGKLMGLFNANIIGLTFNQEQSMTDANDVLLRMFGYSRDDLPIEWDAITPPDQRDLNHRGVQTAIENGHCPPFEIDFLHRDGTRVPTIMGGYCLSVEPLNYISFVLDNSAQKAAEDELRGARDELDSRVRQRTAELVQTNRELRDEMAARRDSEASRQKLMRRLVSVQEDERRRISRELHDQMGQSLTALMMGLKSLPDLPDTGLTPPSLNQRIQSLQSLTADLMEQVHRLAWELRPAALDNLGLEAALRQYVEQWAQDCGIEADFLCRGLSKSSRLPTHLETTIYRVVQEALTNVQRHAGANRVSVLLERPDHHIFVTVEDNGCGFDAGESKSAPQQSAGLRSKTRRAKSGAKVGQNDVTATKSAVFPSGARNGRMKASERLGVLGMQERIEAVGGTLTIESESGRGTTIFARMPIERRKSERESESQ